MGSELFRTSGAKACFSAALCFALGLNPYPWGPRHLGTVVSTWALKLLYYGNYIMGTPPFAAQVYTLEVHRPLAEGLLLRQRLGAAAGRTEGGPTGPEI